MKTNKLLALMVLLVSAGSTHALEKIPDVDGFTGFVSLGGGVAVVESNFLAEAVGNDLSDDNIDELDSPDDESFGIPVAAFELGYVFDGNTQIFVGNLLEDYLRFDFSTRFGVRHNMGAAGRIGVSALQSPIAVKVYENPYATGVDRDSTDRDLSGFRVSWDEIFGTGLEIRFADREVDVDDENSGVGLGLTQAQIDSLDRNGDRTQINVRYLLAQSETSQLVVGINSTEADLDGDAMSYDSTSLEINWIYTPSKDLRLVTNLLGGQRDYDEDNPVFGEKADTDFRAFSATAFFPGAFGFKDWTPNVAFVFGQEDSDVSFFDSKVQILSVGFLTRF